jgi:hypothetical protein
LLVCPIASPLDRTRKKATAGAVVVKRNMVRTLCSDTHG